MAAPAGDDEALIGIYMCYGCWEEADKVMIDTPAVRAAAAAVTEVYQHSGVGSKVLAPNVKAYILNRVKDVMLSLKKSVE